MVGRVDSSAAKSPKFILRVVEFIFSIITFALVADAFELYGSWASKVNFTIFTGVTAMVLCLVFICLYLFGMGDNATVTLVELAVNVIWWIFWLSTAACLADIVRIINTSDYSDVFSDAGKYRASCAFAWLTWALWTLSTLLSVKDVKNRNNGGTMPANNPPMPAGSVGMV